MRRGRHPFVQGSYINDFHKERTLRNMTSKEILEHFNELRQEAGVSKYTHEGRKVYGAVTSV